MAHNIDDIIPLYLADKLSLDQAVQSASSQSQTILLKAILKESKSLPKETDTDPTTPTPDRPSPAQERLLAFVRGVNQNSGSGVLLDYDHDDDSVSGKGCSYEEVRDAMGMDSSLIGRSTSINPDGEDVFASSSEPDPTTTTAAASASAADKKKRRRSSGIEKHLYNLLSFLAFLTAQNLLLDSGVGERIAVEMISEVLDQHSTTTATATTSHKTPSSRPSIASGHTPWFGLLASGSGASAGSGTAPGSEISVSAISLWLIIMGEELYSRAKAQKQKQKQGGGTGEGDSTWTTLSATVIQEWETWTARLQFLALRETLGIEARELASEAAAVMRRV